MCGPKNIEIRKFHKICELNLSEILCDDRHPVGSISDCFFIFGHFCFLNAALDIFKYKIDIFAFLVSLLSFS